jgi:hypothetical protein
MMIVDFGFLNGRGRNGRFFSSKINNRRSSIVNRMSDQALGRRGGFFAEVADGMARMCLGMGKDRFDQGSPHGNPDCR